jgi:two-component system, response regulator PdtaR
MLGLHIGIRVLDLHLCFQFIQSESVMSNGRLLVVENDRTTASIIKMLVQKFDYEVIDIVSAGDHAIRSTRKNNPDLVLMDIKIDGEIDGITAANTIINDFNTPVVYITSYNDKEIMRRARSTSHSGFINKPLREVDLKTTIDFAVNKKPGRGLSQKTKKKLSANELISTFGLTKSESNLVVKLIKNPDLNATSDDFDITINTLRTHLKHIYRKTDANSKAELLMKVVREFDCN